MSRLLLCLAVALAGCAADVDLPPPSIEPRPAPDFSLKDVSGQIFNSEALKGKWIVLNIWASWCPACVREIPSFIELQNKLAKKNVQFVGVAIDEEGGETVAPFAERVKFNYPIFLGDMNFVRDAFGPINAVPTTFIIDPEWRLVDQFTGALDQKVLEGVLRGFISGRRNFGSDGE